LRIIAGLEDITAGDLMIDGDIVNTKSPRDRGIAMVFQSYALYPHMTVYKNIAFGLKLANHDKSAIDQRVREVARILQLDKLLDRRPSELSGGQRQRVAIGRAIVRQPKVFLFDEPLSNLDAALRVQTRIEIAKLHQELQSTIVYVTHDQVEAMTLADKIVVMNAGNVEQVGSPMQLYHHPQTRFVAGFIGSPAMNFTTVHVDAVAQGKVTVTVPGGAKAVLPFDVPVDDIGKDVELGVRPEHLTLSRNLATLPICISSSRMATASRFAPLATAVLKSARLLVQQPNPGHPICLTSTARLMPSWNAHRNIVPTNRV
jgi:multiple sugar transport system ATP-binding protein